ncbi:MAG: hypothetical protein NT178_13865 [Proteobacteria bacterium]|nr:hypothetical protein [Pseudomonadota bacterium]
MKIFASLIVAYIITGLARAMKDIFSRPIDMPGWARHPTLGMLLSVILGWPLLLMRESMQGNAGRGFIFGLISIGAQIIFIGAIIWCLISVIVYLFNLVF